MSTRVAHFDVTVGAVNETQRFMTPLADGDTSVRIATYNMSGTLPLASGHELGIAIVDAVWVGDQIDTDGVTVLQYRELDSLSTLSMSGNTTTSVIPLSGNSTHVGIRFRNTQSDNVGRTFSLLVVVS